ncbi:hypothetical protein [Chitinimonas koreensis]|uniref:hypothetical protein n=1 Tax=Chitinimonas koreensis TaxID=356302 RepID=UPI000423FAC5|nr:hypothetical protein [Chitinimonas koreensis]QNM97019.1 hypothetical protein H9L41_01360 [Chitinimonas koreensis]
MRYKMWMLMLGAALAAAGCATSSQLEQNQEEAREEPEYVTGSSIPRRGSGDVRKAEAQDVIDKARQARSVTTKGPGG